MTTSLEPQNHQGIQVFVRWLFVTLCLCGSTVFLQGCSSLGIGENDYACPEPGKGVCKSARQVYQDTNGLTAESSMPPSPSPTLSTPLDRSLVVPEAVPQRLPAQVLRIWIAPWVDKQGNWHSGGVVMTDIYPREWQSAVPVYSPSEHE